MRILLICICLLSLIFSTSFGVLRKAPAGTHHVQGLTNTFLDKTEVTNIAWREYLYDLATNGDSATYLAALPDQAVWEMAYKTGFKNGNRYDAYPVVGVNYDQVRRYCEWRSRIVSAKEKRDIVYSLPSMKVYKLTLRGQDGNKIAEGLYSTNLGFRTFVGLCDNASEMTDREGKALMGSKRADCLETFDYFSASPDLGFRCMATLQ